MMSWCQVSLRINTYVVHPSIAFLTSYNSILDLSFNFFPVLYYILWLHDVLLCACASVVASSVVMVPVLSFAYIARDAP